MLCDKEFEGKGAVVGREEKLFNQPICQPNCWAHRLRSSSAVEIICLDQLVRVVDHLLKSINCWDYLLSSSVEISCWDHLLWSAVKIIWFELINLPQIGIIKSWLHYFKNQNLQIPWFLARFGKGTLCALLTLTNASCPYSLQFSQLRFVFFCKNIFAKMIECPPLNYQSWAYWSAVAEGRWWVTRNSGPIPVGVHMQSKS